MPEAGLSAAEVGKEIAEHLEKNRDHELEGRGRRITIIEAILLATVALLAAWSGFAAAKWSTESRLELSQSTKHRTLSSEAELRAMEATNFDASTFNAWFTAWVAGDEKAQTLATRRFTDEFKVAFDAWIATDPANNPDAPKGPTYMPEYVQPDHTVAEDETRLAEEAYEKGSKSGETADDYVRITVLLASVLFLVGISGHFRIHSARVGLICVSGAILTYAVVLLIMAPKPT
jgi:hypothetical protein